MRKLVLSLLSVVIIAIFGLGWGLDRLFEQLADKRSTDEITVLGEIGSTLANTLDQLENPDQHLSRMSYDSFKFNLHTQEEFPLPEELAEGLVRGEPLVLDSESGLSLHFYLPSHRHILSLTPTYLIHQYTERNLNLVFTIVFYSGILFLTLLWAYPLVTRLLRIRSAAKRFGEGDLAERITPGRFSYIRDIENEFNRMADKIQSLISDNKMLASAVSHDLRTPLARLRFGLDTLAETRDPQKQRQYHERIGKDLDEMENLVSTLLSYARLDQSMEALVKKPLDLLSLVQELLQRMRADFPGIEWRSSVKDCFIEGDKRHLQMMLNNVLQNARKYSQGKILVTLELLDNGRCGLSIEDNGEGIAESDRAEMLKPFVRGAGQDNKGYGMGLAIVARIALWHEAKLSILCSEELGGANIRLDFKPIQRD